MSAVLFKAADQPRLWRSFILNGQSSTKQKNEHDVPFAWCHLPSYFADICRPQGKIR
jgi:hypothetical protein